MHNLICENDTVTEIVMTFIKKMTEFSRDASVNTV